MGRLSQLLILVTLIHNCGSFAFNPFQTVTFGEVLPALGVKELGTTEDKLMKEEQQNLQEEVANLTSSMNELLKNALTVKEEEISRKESHQSLTQKVESLNSAVTSMKDKQQSMEKGVESMVSSVSLVKGEVMSMKESQQSLTKKVESLATSVKNIEKKIEKDQHLCDVPTSIPKGTLLNTDGQKEGSRAEFVCDDFYIPTTEAGICDTSGTWAGLNNPCQPVPNTPYNIPAEGKLRVGSSLIIIATPTAEARFGICLGARNGDRLMNLGVQFKFGGNYHMLVRATQISGTWGNHETSTPNWPLVVNQEFNMTVVVEETLFRVYVDDAEWFTYRHRLPILEFTRVIFAENVALRQIRFIR